MSYRPVRLHRLAESIPWNRFLGSLKVYKFGFRLRDESKEGSRSTRETIRDEGIIESRRAEGL